MSSIRVNFLTIYVILCSNYKTHAYCHCKKKDILPKCIHEKMKKIMVCKKENI